MFQYSAKFVCESYMRHITEKANKHLGVGYVIEHIYDVGSCSHNKGALVVSAKYKQISPLSYR